MKNLTLNTATATATAFQDGFLVTFAGTINFFNFLTGQDEMTDRAKEVKAELEAQGFKVEPRRGFDSTFFAF